MKKLALLFCFTYAFMGFGHAQSYGANKNNWNIGLYVGVNNYFGDVSNSKNKFIFSDPFTKDFYQNRYPMFQFSIGNNILPYWNLRLNVLYGNLRNQSNDLDYRFIAYHTHEIALINAIDIFELTSIDRWHLNIHAGIACYGFKTALFDSELNTTVVPKPQTFKYSFTIPFGLGFSYDINDNWKFTFDIMYHWVTSDSLDAYKSDLKKFEGFSYAAIGFQYAFQLPTIRLNNARRNFPLSRNYGFNAMGIDKTHKLYKQRKQRGNLTPVNKTQRNNRKVYKNVNSRKYILRSRR